MNSSITVRVTGGVPDIEDRLGMMPDGEYVISGADLGDGETCLGISCQRPGDTHPVVKADLFYHN